MQGKDVVICIAAIISNGIPRDKVTRSQISNNLGVVL
jgi:hypothetical protein